ncbi:MAG: PASTA domain-containing protein [Gemmatimonadaceae bacterium]|nr:PASTA domain-containing protein [Gemmatimonadaceae bacterium]
MPRPNRLTVIHGVLVLFAAALIAQSAKVQIVHGKEWTERGRKQHFFSSSLPAARGDILDASGEMLVESRELVRIAIAPPEVRDTAKLLRSMRQVGMSDAILKSVIDSRHKWIDVPGVFVPPDVATLVSMRGVHATAVMQRVYSTSPGIRRIVGRLDPAGNALDGIEAALDSTLRGDSARASVARDKRGNALGSPLDAAGLSHDGATIVLTINHALQDICERALAEAIDSLHASGGDIVVMNPHTGDVLALVSQRTDAAAVANTSVTEPFEPGSTLKPFVAAALLTKKRARPDEVISTYGGKLELEGRTITDTHPAASLSLFDVIKFSSNIGIVMFGQRLTPREKYENFRDFGFGSPTGITLPAESPGTLREPRTWSKQTPASVLMGYEIAVTPLQLVTAYSSIANGGDLLEPHIVKEIRAANGDVLYKADKRVVRRVLSRDVAHTVQQMLLGVVQGGTATKADLQTFEVAGKSGTARRVVNGQGYSAGNYTASFVGLFPGDDPQYVVLVKLDSPQGTHYAGGEIAAPVTNVVLRAALAARDAALNRQSLAASEKRDTVQKPLVASNDVHPDTVALVSPSDSDAGSISYVVHLPSPNHTAPVTLTPRVIPDVRGMTLRAAVHALHAAGFRVQLVGSPAIATNPAAGSVALAGTTVQLGHPSQ